MMRRIDFWVGNGLLSGWYAVFYLAVAAGVAEGFDVGGPLLFFSIIHTVVFLLCGGGSVALRLLWGLGLAGVTALAVALPPGLPWFLVVLVGNLRLLWVSRHAAPALLA
jgi:hypothetical protein